MVAELVEYNKSKGKSTYVWPHSTVVKYLWEPIFLEFELKDGAPDAELFLDDCWITGSKEFGNTSQWNIIVDGQVTLVQYCFCSCFCQADGWVQLISLFKQM